MSEQLITIYKTYDNDTNKLNVWLRNFVGHIVIIEGPISAGKTTLGKSIEHLFKRYDVKCIFLEEYKNDALLNFYIQNMKNNAFTFQMIMLRERFRIYMEAVRLANDGYAVFMDRGLVGDLAFALMQMSKKFFTDEQTKIYMSMLESEKNNIIEPSLTVFLKLSPSKAYQRLIKRNNEVEVSNYSVEYFTELESAYKRANDIIDIPITQLEWTDEKQIVGEYVSDKDVLEFLQFVHTSLFSMKVVNHDPDFDQFMTTQLDRLREAEEYNNKLRKLVETYCADDDSEHPVYYNGNCYVYTDVGRMCYDHDNEIFEPEDAYILNDKS